MARVTRRRVLRLGGVVGAAAVLPATANIVSAEDGREAYRFFDAWEAKFIEASVDRLIPPDPVWAGAKEAGVPLYLDRQLAGDFGKGARMYRAGPWKNGTPHQGYQLRFTPAELYKLSLERIRALAEDFPTRQPAAQDLFLTELEEGRHDLSGVSSAIFFETLLANTIEGFFADPVYGGNRGKVGWRMIGFPGAHAAYLGLYTRHGLAVNVTPLGMDEVGGHHDSRARR